MTVRYGSPIEILAQTLDIEDVSNDPSFDLLYHLAGAYRAAVRLQEAGVDITLSGRLLLSHPLRAAHREALHIRSTRVPKELLDVSKISKLGRLNESTNVD